jgi:hypothetical protein
MTLNIDPRQWTVFAVLIAVQVLSMTLTVHLNTTRPAWIYFPLFAVPNNANGWFIAFEMTTCSCFVTALIIVALWDGVRQKRR